jgi:L,D-transpeptidase YcbB
MLLSPRKLGSVFLALLFVALVGPSAAQTTPDSIRIALFEAGSAGIVEGHRVDLEALRQFYDARDSYPAWGSSEQSAIVGLIENAWRDGLDPEVYGLDALRALGAAADSDATMAARRDILLTAGLGEYLRDLRFGRAGAGRLDASQHVYSRPQSWIDLVTEASAGGAKVLADRLRPASPQYRDLRSALLTYTLLQAAGGWAGVPDGPTLRPGDRDPRILAVRARLQAEGFTTLAATPPEPELFDTGLTAAIREFQQRNTLTPDGSVGRGTLAALNVPISDRIRQIQVTMERWRWMPDDLGDRHIVVNIAGFEMRLVRHGVTELAMGVQVGLPYRQTPMFSDMMRYIEFNPTWNVPPSIANKDILPKQIKDPTYLTRNGFTLYKSWTEDGDTVDPIKVQWSSYQGRRMPFRLRQDPGPTNALGRMKFMFPNEHDVYLHDTPHDELFARADRAFSSGCIRLADPDALAAHLLGEQGIKPEQIATWLAGRQTKVISLKTRIPVHLTYSTVWKGEDGAVRFGRDIYGRDARMAEALFGPAS